MVCICVRFFLLCAVCAWMCDAVWTVDVCLGVVCACACAHVCDVFAAVCVMMYGCFLMFVCVCVRKCACVFVCDVWCDRLCLLCDVCCRVHLC